MTDPFGCEHRSRRHREAHQRTRQVETCRNGAASIRACAVTRALVSWRTHVSIGECVATARHDIREAAQPQASFRGLRMKRSPWRVGVNAIRVGPPAASASSAIGVADRPADLRQPATPEPLFGRRTGSGTGSLSKRESLAPFARAINRSRNCASPQADGRQRFRGFRHVGRLERALVEHRGLGLPLMLLSALPECQLHTAGSSNWI
jgi:hypothetical protein